MILAHRAALNGIQLDEIDERIVIQGIEENAGQEKITTTARPGGGSRVTGKRRETLDVIIHAAIRIKRDDMPAREAVLEKINAWASGGGYLTTSQRPGRRLRVEMAQAPGMGDPRDWTAVFNITMRAYGIPYWEQETMNSAVAGEGQTGSVSMNVEGSAETKADITLANISGAEINTATVTAGGNTMSFSALGLGGNESLVIDHDEEGLLRIRIWNGSSWRSAMAKRTVGSADDLTIRPGARGFSFAAQRSCRMTVGYRGRYV